MSRNKNSNKIYNLNYVSILEHLVSIDYVTVNELSLDMKQKFDELKVNKTQELEKKIARRKSERSWFMCLPITVQYKILKKLDHYSLMTFASEHLNYLDIVIQPCFWKYLKIEFNSILINESDVYHLLCYLNKHLRSFEIDFSLLEKYSYKQFFDKIPYLNSLKIRCKTSTEPNIVNDICKRFHYLTEIGIVWNLLDNNHLKQIADCYPHLFSITVYTIQDVDDALCYLIGKMKSITKLDIVAPILTEKTLKTLFKLHSNYLKEFSLNLFWPNEFDCDLLLDLRNVINLQVLRLHRFKYTEKYLKMLSELKTVDTFELNYNFKYIEVEMDLSCKIFTTQNLKLRELVLINTRLTDEGFYCVVQNCPCLRKVTLRHCLLSENGCKKALSMLNVEYLELKFTNLMIYTVLFDFLSEAPDSPLKYLQKIDILKVYLPVADEELELRIIKNFEYFSNKRQFSVLKLKINTKFTNF